MSAYLGWLVALILAAILTVHLHRDRTQHRRQQLAEQWRQSVELLRTGGLR